jgi:hypothetical protein
VLARLRKLAGVADARVECSGLFFVLSLTERADPDAAARAALDALGPGSRRVPSDEARPQLDARRRGEIWFSEEEIRALSYVEARIVTNRALAAATQGLSLAPAQVESIREAIRVEVFAAIDRVHDEGGRSSSGWFAAEWPGIVGRTRARLAGAVPEAILAETSARLVRQH